ncbi:MAG: glycosyltransferase family 2 protein [Planctomycetes bacterium]|nr:glycosyltransferase family 2 protein [Planctomycetota bacterium]
MSPTAVASPARTECAAVVVHYRDAEATLDCIDSLAAQEPPPAIVVVDNGSPDGSGAQLERHLADRRGVHLLHAGVNGGFGAGCNRGIEFALQRWPELAHVLLLNPDAELARGSLAELLATSRRHPDAGIVGCHIEDHAGRTWFANGQLPRWTLSGFHCPAPPAPEFPTTFVTGACMLLRADLLRDGLRFDESYFLYCEDADLCCEVRARGHGLWITQRARVRHVGGGSQPGPRVLGELTAERLFWLTRAKVLFARRRLGAAHRLGFLAIACLLKPLAGLVGSGSVRFLGPYLRGLLSGLRGDPGPAPHRAAGLNPSGLNPSGLNPSGPSRS